MRYLGIILGPIAIFIVAAALFLVTSNTVTLAESGKSKTIEAAEKSPEWQVLVTRPKTPTVSELKSNLDQTDVVAALRALHIALMEVADGSTFVWHKKDRRLKGAVKPTSSFRARNGMLCRHLEFSLALPGYIKAIESIACRNKKGAWVLEG